MRKLILASLSPRRKELLHSLGLKFTVVPSKVEEKLNPRLKPRAQAESLSLQKAQAVASKHPDAIILSADTIVVIDNEILGKPLEKETAKRMLRKLQGRMHKVITAFTLVDPAKKQVITRVIETKLFMKPLTEKEIEIYIVKENHFDTAGGYMINGIGAILFEKIDGDYTNVVGLPLFAVTKELKKFGITIL